MLKKLTLFALLATLGAATTPAESRAAGGTFPRVMYYPYYYPPYYGPSVSLGFGFSDRHDDGRHERYWRDHDERWERH